MFWKAWLKQILEIGSLQESKVWRVYLSVILSCPASCSHLERVICWLSSPQPRAPGDTAA
ncbi:hypothetical protein OIDMADRAFT_17887 [Oidiodendron maius Zn]|uniref:Uncharacterized protein n=1 Tax=Oidiodendron maius (strain Zn) TaxID=913774 RepID=A0A0C3HSU0_OIDMZ|nr:hypothetical protein OIDMADRAFT_17887 [Oidiodendron maius Zn]